jgi:tRNA(Ile)-lysidine synthase
VQRLTGGRVHLRPLLGLKKRELTTALRAVGLEWREDSSNATGIFYRNRIRREVLPRWIRAAQRDALAGAALARRLLEEDDAALEAWVAELQPIGVKGRLSLRRLRGKPRAVWRRALRLWLARNCPQADLSRQAFETLLDSLEAGRETRHSLTRNRLAVMNKCYLRLAVAPARPGAFYRCAN